MRIDLMVKVLAALGILFLLMSGVVWLLGRSPLVGHLPGDIYSERRGVQIYFPLATCLLASIVLTIIINLLLGR